MPLDLTLDSTGIAGLDPILIWLLRSSLAALFAFSAIHKLRDMRGFEQALRGYRIIPESAASLAALSFSIVEFCLALLLLIPAWAPLAGMGGAALLSIYSLAISTNLARGRHDIDCGCLGPGHGLPLSNWLLVRNGLLILAAIIASFSPAPRALSWIDGVSGVGGLVTLALLFLAANQLAANGPPLPARLPALAPSPGQRRLR